MMTRADYMAKSSTEAHRAYFGEIAREIAPIRIPFSVEQVKAALASGDEHLNSLPLSSWDAAVPSLRGATAALKARGDWLSFGTGVCILKEYARQLAEQGK